MQEVLQSTGAQYAPMAKTTTETGEEVELQHFKRALEIRTPAESDLAPRTLTDWRSRKLPWWARWLVRNPWALDALQKDADAARRR